MIYTAKPERFTPSLQRERYRGACGGKLRENSAEIFVAADEKTRDRDATTSLDLCGPINLGYRARLRIRIIGRVNEPCARARDRDRSRGRARRWKVKKGKSEKNGSWNPP